MQKENEVRIHKHQEQPLELDTSVAFVAFAAFEEPFELAVHEDFSLAPGRVEIPVASPAERELPAD